MFPGSIWLHVGDKLGVMDAKTFVGQTRQDKTRVGQGR
jgi:hypothetical protein